MQDLNKTKEELERVLEKKENNLVRLKFDFYYANLKFPGLEKKFKVVHDAVVQIDGELSVAKVPARKDRDKEKIVNLQTKLRELQEKEVKIEREKDLARQDIDKSKHYIEETKKLIASLKDCIKIPNLIYEKYVE